LAAVGAGFIAERGTGSHRNRFDGRAEILPLPLRSHALMQASIFGAYPKSGKSGRVAAGRTSGIKMEGWRWVAD